MSRFRNNRFRFITRPLSSLSRIIPKSVREVLTNKTIMSRFGVTIAVIVIYRILANIPLPGIDMNVYLTQFGNQATSQVGYLLTIFTGGRLDSPSLVGLGIGVYITASIIIQLLTTIVPYLEQMSKEGARGKQVIDQYTRYLTIPLAIMYSIGYLYLLAQQNLGSDPSNPVYLIPHLEDGSISILRILFMTLILTAGSTFLMWLAEAVTERGIGNGSSVLMTTGILANLPALVSNDFSLIDIPSAVSKVLQGSLDALRDPGMIALYLIVGGGVLLIAGIIFMTESTRKIIIQYARRERAGGSTDSFLPLKLNQSGVLPIIFASSLLTTPQLLVPLIEQVTDPASPIGSFVRGLRDTFLFANAPTTTGTLTISPHMGTYNLVYLGLIVVFSLFYAFIALKPDDFAENLQKNGGFIPGIRPGKSTQDYISRVMLRLNLVGALFLGAIALIPVIAGNTLTTLTGQTFTLFSGVGGTSILIIVGVVLETARQINSLQATQDYERYI